MYSIKAYQLRALLLACPKRDPRKVLLGVNFRPSKTTIGQDVAEATDGKILLQCNITQSAASQDSVIIRREELDLVIQFLGRRKAFHSSEVCISKVGGKWNIKCEGVTLAAQDIIGNFPNADYILDLGDAPGKRNRASFNNYILERAMKIHKTVSPLDSSVDLEFWGESHDLPVLVRDKRKTFKMIIMPLKRFTDEEDD